MMNVLFVPTNKTTWAEFIPLSQVLHEAGADIKFLICEETTDDQLVNEAKDLGFFIIDRRNLHENQTVKANAVSFIGCIKNKLREVDFILNNYRKIRLKLISTVLRSFVVKKRIRKAKQHLEWCRRCLQDNDINRVIVSGDRAGLMNLAMLATCRKLGIKSIIPSFAYTAVPQSLMVIRRKDPLFYDGIHLILANKYPNFYHFDPVFQKNVCYYSITELEAIIETGIAPKNPWIIGGGNSDVVLVDGKDAYDRYISHGCRPDKLRMTGRVSYDELYRRAECKDSLRNEVLKKYQLRDRKTIIVALPQLAEHNILPWDRHWEEINYLADTLSKSNANILISLHPKMKRDSYQSIADKYALTLLDEPLSYVLPIADLFTATYSSTIEWAVLCRIPVVLFDFYGLNYDVYSHLKSIKVVNVKTQFESLLRNMLSHGSRLMEEMCLNMNEEAETISHFDGQCRNRIIKSILS